MIFPPRRSWRRSRTPGVAAERDLGVELRWIFDIPADFGMPAADVTAAVALDHDVPGLVGFGIGGAETGFPRSMFQDHFDRARAAGLHSVPHAGETTGPETIWDALIDLGAERIEHGITAVHDHELLAHLAEHQITLDVCPTSNVALKVVEDLDRHPIRELVAAGVPVTVNSDDPPMFGTDLNHEYADRRATARPRRARRGRPGPGRRTRLVRLRRHQVRPARRDRPLSVRRG